MKDFQVTKEKISAETTRPALAFWPEGMGRLCFIALFGIVLLVLSGALLPRLQFFIENVSHWLNYPYFQAGSEGLMLSEAAIVRAGGSLYVPLRPDQFISGPYPPLYYYLLAALWPAGQGATAGFLTGRLISLVSALVAALFIALLVNLELRANHPVKWKTFNNVALVLVGIVAGAIYLSMPAVAVWAVRVRADMLMVAFQMIGLCLLAWRPRHWPAFAAILPLTLAFYTKHTGLAAPAAATVFVVLQNWRNWKRILFWLISFASAVGLPFLVLNLLTGLELYRRLFPYHDLGRDDRNFERYLSLFWQENAALLIISAILLLFTIYDLYPFGHRRFTIKRTSSESGSENPSSNSMPASEANHASSIVNRQWPRAAQSSILNLPLSVLFLLFSLPLLLGMGVVGTDHNHFLPGEAAGCAAAGVLVGRWLILPGRNRLRWLTLLGLMGLWVQVAVCAIPAQRYEIEFRQENADYQRQLGKIIENAAAQSGPILTSEAAFLVMTNRSFDHDYYNDLFTIAALSSKGRYSLDGILKAVRNKEFGLILAQGDFFTGDRIRPDVWPPELVTAIKENYQQKFRDVWFVYEPKT